MLSRGLFFCPFFIDFRDALGLLMAVVSDMPVVFVFLVSLLVLFFLCRRQLFFFVSGLSSFIVNFLFGVLCVLWGFLVSCCCCLADVLFVLQLFRQMFVVARLFSLALLVRF